jgi:hypothetical protein
VVDEGADDCVDKLGAADTDGSPSEASGSAGTTGADDDDGVDEDEGAAAVVGAAAGGEGIVIICMGICTGTSCICGG